MPEPVSLEEAKARLGVRSNHRDAELLGCIAAARLRIEGLTGHLLVKRAVTQFFTSYSGPLELHAFPVASVDLVEARDASTGVFTAVPGPVLDADVAPARVFPATGSFWPAAGSQPGLRVTMTAGYEADEVPADLLQALYLLVGHYFENHEAVVVGSPAIELPLGVKDICGDYRLPGIV